MKHFLFAVQNDRISVMDEAGCYVGSPVVFNTLVADGLEHRAARLQLVE